MSRWTEVDGANARDSPTPRQTSARGGAKRAIAASSSFSFDPHRVVAASFCFVCLCLVDERQRATVSSMQIVMVVVVVTVGKFGSPAARHGE